MPFTQALSERGRFAIVDEGATFGTDSIASIGTALRVPVIRGSLTPSQPQDMLAPNTLQTNIDGYEEDVIGAKGPVSLQFTTRFASHDTPLTGNVTPPDETTWWMALLLMSMGWGLSKETPAAATTQVQAGSTTTVINVTAGHGTRFAVGRALGVVIGGILYPVPIKSISTDAITLKHALPSVPSNGSTVYQSVTFYPAGDAAAVPTKHLNAFFEGGMGADSGNPTFATSRWQYRGISVGGFALTLAARQLADIQWTLMGPTWSKLAASAPAIAAAVSKFGPMAVKDSEMVVTTVGNTTRSVTSYNAIQIAQNWELQTITGPDGVETVLDYLRVKSDEPVSAGQITDHWSIASPANRDWYSHHQNRDDLAFFIKVGSQPGACWLIEESTVQIGPPQQAGVSKAAGVTFPYKGRNDADLGDGSELLRAPRRLHAF